MDDLAKLFQVLSDSTRLRILNLLKFGALSVFELQTILKTSQSATSRHLGILRDFGLIDQKRSGQSVFYSRKKNLSDSHTSRTLEIIESSLDSADLKNNERAYSAVLRKREKKASLFFNENISLWEEVRSQIYSQAVDKFLLASLIPRETKILDLGCGNGGFIKGMLPLVDFTIGLDNNFKLIHEAGKSQQLNSHWICANALELPFRENSFDSVFSNLVIHYLSDPQLAIEEMSRVIRPGAKVIILYLMPLKAGWYESFVHKLDFLWPGFHPQELQDWFSQTGLDNTKVHEFEHELVWPLTDKKSRIKRMLKYFVVSGEKKTGQRTS